MKQAPQSLPQPPPKEGAFEIGGLSIRQAGFTDAAMLAALGRRTFEEAFADQNTPENLAAYISEAYTTEQFAKELRDENSVFYVARLNQTPVGYAKLRKNGIPENSLPAGEAGIFENTQTPRLAMPCMELQRIYVLRENIGTGTGKRLMEQCLQTARQHGCATLWLGVWERNEKAIAFYGKWGFTVFGSHIFHVGNDPQTDLLMRLEL